MDNQVQEAVRILNRGGIIIFPTDTAFGIGCRIDNELSIKKLFKIRKRPESQAVPVLVSSLKMAREYAAEIPSKVIEKLIKPYWPGALTIVLKANLEKIPSLVRGGGETIGLRMPDHRTMLEIIGNVGVPILGPSANFHGDETPFSLQDLNPELVSLVDDIVKGECSVKKTSTVVDCAKEPWQILRQGAATIKI